METIKTKRQLTVEFRDKIAARIVEQEANVLYWKKVARQCKSNTPEIVQALSAIDVNKDLIKKDELFLKCIDEMLQEIN